METPEGEMLLGTTRPTWLCVFVCVCAYIYIYSSRFYRKRITGCQQYLFGLGYGGQAGFGDHDYEPLHYIKCVEFLDYI
jgi:hypothetical protein